MSVTDKVQDILEQIPVLLYQVRSTDPPTAASPVRRTPIASAAAAADARVRGVSAPQGNYDLQDGPTGNLAWLTELPWSGKSAFRAARRWVWKVEGRRAGYVKQAKTLRHIVVLNAGHMVPRDQGAPLFSLPLRPTAVAASVCAGEVVLMRPRRRPCCQRPQERTP